ncbi:hypothetical protein D5085_00065 [Ectothiorhodospiraceae bacterium BW-2]|nr:hypothetical protein D5085_00065 [Ectothiorhodospiraceae bacterium BW-2]
MGLLGRNRLVEPLLHPSLALLAQIRGQNPLQSASQPLPTCALPLLFSLKPQPQLALFAADTIEQLRERLEADRPLQPGEEGGGGCRCGFYCRDLSDYQRLKQRALANLAQRQPDRGWIDQICFYPAPLSGEVAAIFTGAAAAYCGAAESLVADYPLLVRALAARFGGELERYGGWLYPRWSGESSESRPFNELIGSSFVAQLHALISRQIWGLAPEAAFGLSSGETNALLAFDVWDDIGQLLDAIWQANLYQTELAGEYRAVKRYWGIAPESPMVWQSWILYTDAAQVRPLLADYERLYLTIILSDSECVVAGEASACQALLARLPKVRHTALRHELACHAPVLGDFEPLWRQLHTRPVQPQSRVRFYSNYLNGPYRPTSASVAEALTGQAGVTIDFSKSVRQAFADGVRIFIEHGPRNSLTRAIAHILSPQQLRHSLTIAMDEVGSDSVAQLYRNTVELWCAGQPLQLNQFSLYQPALERTLTLTPVPPLLTEAWAETLAAYCRAPNPAMALATVTMPTAPALKLPPLAPLPSRRPGAGSLAVLIATLFQQQSQLHQHFLALQQQQFELYRRTLLPLRGLPPLPLPLPATAAERHDYRPLGPTFSRQDLEILASGKISTLFGAAFSDQDRHLVQVRMPQPPLLLCDRVTGIDAEPQSMGLGTIWTETDVKHDSWYLHQGVMPGGIFIESGQADLLLISWLGIDSLNQGQRAYRLLGCELQFLGDLPRAGERLHYQICVDGHAQSGDIRLFFFHYDCYINGQKRLSVRHGQAGFFTRQELEEASGVLWRAEEATYADSPLPPPRWHSNNTAFRPRRLSAISPAI